MRGLGLSGRLFVTITILSTVLVAAVTAATGFFVYFQTETQMKSQLTGAARTIIADYLMAENGAITLRKRDDGQSLATYLRMMDLNLAIVDASGSSVARYGLYRSIDDRTFPSVFGPQDFRRVAGTPSGWYGDKYVADIGTLDTFTAPLSSGGNALGYIQVMRLNYLWPIIVRSLVWALVMQIPLTWVSAMIVIHWGTRHTLRPLNELAVRVGALDLDSLPSSLELTNPMDGDVKAVLDTLNALIRRVRTTLQRERELAQNLSHEFKAPFARIGARLLKLRDLDDPHRRVVESIQRDIVAMGQQVDSLLDVALHETTAANGDRPWHVKPFMEELTASLPEGGRYSIDIPDTLLLSMPIGHARTLWRNILDNAMKYGVAGGEIRISGSSEAGRWKICVTNAFSDVPAPSASVFLRRYRGLVTHSVQGYGLGMAIVRDIARQLGLDVSFVTDDKDRVAVEVSGKV